MKNKISYFTFIFLFFIMLFLYSERSISENSSGGHTICAEPKPVAWQLASVPPSLPPSSPPSSCVQLMLLIQGPRIHPGPCLPHCSSLSSGSHHISTDGGSPTIKLACLPYILHKARGVDFLGLTAAPSITDSNPFRGCLDACKFQTWCMWTFMIWTLLAFLSLDSPGLQSPLPPPPP